jgi:hypothetical protein
MNPTSRQRHGALADRADRQGSVPGSVRRRRVRPGRDELLRTCLAGCVASGGAPRREFRVQLGTGPQSMERGLKSENGRMACIPCPLVRMTISADWSPLS